MRWSDGGGRKGLTGGVGVWGLDIWREGSGLHEGLECGVWINRGVESQEKRLICQECGADSRRNCLINFLYLYSGEKVGK